MKEFALMLDGTHFTFCRLDADGERTGKVQEWKIRPGNSMLPASIFFLIQKRLRKATSRRPGDLDAVAEALIEAGRDCDCVAQAQESPFGVLWLKDQKHFIWFGISDRPFAKSTVALLRFRVDLQGFINPEMSGVEKW